MSPVINEGVAVIFKKQKQNNYNIPFFFLANK